MLPIKATSLLSELMSKPRLVKRLGGRHSSPPSSDQEQTTSPPAEEGQTFSRPLSKTELSSLTLSFLPRALATLLSAANDMKSPDKVDVTDHSLTHNPIVRPSRSIARTKRRALSDILSLSTTHLPSSVGVDGSLSRHKAAKDGIRSRMVKQRMRANWKRADGESMLVANRITDKLKAVKDSRLKTDIEPARPAKYGEVSHIIAPLHLLT
jgi:hypothetical protein